MPWPFDRRRRDIDDEIGSHLAMAERDRLARGEPQDEVRRAVTREFGNVDLVKEVTRDVRGRRLERLSNDIRRACRRIVHKPGASTTIVLMLGLAVGLTTAMFAVTDAL